MANACLIAVYDGFRQTPVYTGEFDEPVELGRQSKEDEALYCPQRTRDHWRLAIARPEEQTLSRRYLRVEPLPASRIKLANLSAHLPGRFFNGTELPPGGMCELLLPVLITLGTRTVHIREPIDPNEQQPIQSLPHTTRLPEEGPLSTTLISSLSARPAGQIDDETLVRWLQTALDVLQSAATSSDFFTKAVGAAIELARLDSARVLLWTGEDWKTQAEQTAPRLTAEQQWRPSREILARVRQEKRTFWQSPGDDALGTISLRGVRAVVAAPILDRQGEVMAVLYGDCWCGRGGAPVAHLTRLDASLIELLAGVVAAGLARLAQERATLALRLRLEQFFPAELVPILEEQPERLEEARDTDVTILFCDVRGFSRISERLGPARTVQWVRAVMEALSDCVLAHRGVLVNYIGDELMAMWGAPFEQPDHPERACRAALAMLDLLGPLNETWEPILGEPIALGVGLNTGVARVGNTGTQRKFTYGPLGKTVNLASRVEGATKYLRTSPLITGSTRARLGPEFACRRLCQARVVNIAEPVELYELARPDQPAWRELRACYEEALERFANRDFPEAVRLLGGMLPKHPNDGPALVLLARAVNALVAEPAQFDPVWELPGK